MEIWKKKAVSVDYFGKVNTANTVKGQRQKNEEEYTSLYYKIIHER
jgi:hypothetical protein